MGYELKQKALEQVEESLDERIKISGHEDVGVTRLRNQYLLKPTCIIKSILV